MTSAPQTKEPTTTHPAPRSALFAFKGYRKAAIMQCADHPADPCSCYDPRPAIATRAVNIATAEHAKMIRNIAEAGATIARLQSLPEPTWVETDLNGHLPTRADLIANALDTRAFFADDFAELCERLIADLVDFEGQTLAQLDPSTRSAVDTIHAMLPPRPHYDHTNTTDTTDDFDAYRAESAWFGTAFSEYNN